VTLAFASEMKALQGLHGGRLDPQAVDLYFALGYVPAPLGIFRNTRKLAPGHLARWQNGTLRVERWWFPERAPLAGGGPDRPAELRELMAESVRIRLRSDVPVAVALSGGVDSSIVAAELARQGATPDAFTVVFDGDETDLPYARLAARRFGLRHELIGAGGRDIPEELADAVRRYDEPFADSSALGSLALARALAGRYKVILNGDGGDEAFAGYSHYEFIGVKQWIKTAAAAAGWRDGSGRAGVYVESKVAFRRAERQCLLAGRAEGDALESLLGAPPFPQAGSRGALKRALWSDRHLYLANNLTYKMDLALASEGMEGRAPFLDHRVLEWAQNLPAAELVRGREKKVLLRRTYAAELPEEILRRPKHGFGAPVGAWLAGPLAALGRESIPTPLLDASAQSGLSGQRKWALLCFAKWAETWGARW
jgi:asparagine synthase (glutamine-hydrolysing)